MLIIGLILGGPSPFVTNAEAEQDPPGKPGICSTCTDGVATIIDKLPSDISCDTAGAVFGGACAVTFSEVPIIVVACAAMGAVSADLCKSYGLPYMKDHKSEVAKVICMRGYFCWK